MRDDECILNEHKIKKIQVHFQNLNVNVYNKKYSNSMGIRFVSELNRLQAPHNFLPQ